MLTALWIVNTMPVNTAAMSATPSDCTPMTSTSRTTTRKYLGGSARLRQTRPVRRPTPPYQIVARLRYASMSLLRREALDEPPEVAPPRPERRRRRGVHEIVDTALALDHVRLDARRRPVGVGTPVHHRVRRGPPRDGRAAAPPPGAGAQAPAAPGRAAGRAPAANGRARCAAHGAARAPRAPRGTGSRTPPGAPACGTRGRRPPRRCAGRPRRRAPRRSPP